MSDTREVTASYHYERRDLDLLITCNVSGEYIRGVRASCPLDDVMPEAPTVDEVIKIETDDEDSILIMTEAGGSCWAAEIIDCAMADGDFIQSILEADSAQD